MEMLYGASMGNRLPVLFFILWISTIICTGLFAADGDKESAPGILVPLGVVVTHIEEGADPNPEVHLHTPFVFSPSVGSLIDPATADQLRSEAGELTPLFNQLQGTFTDQMGSHSADEMKKILEKDQIQGEDKIGKGIVRAVDGQVFYRVVHEQSGRSYILFDQGKVDKESSAYKKMIARQLLDSGPTNAAGRRLGRDVVVLERDPETGEIKEMDHITRPTPGSKDWWGHWGNAVRGNGINRANNFLIIGIPATAAQVGLVYLWGWIGGHDMDVRRLNAALAITFSMTISTFVDVYRNYINLGSDPNHAAAIPRLLKHTLISFGFAYPATIVRFGWDSMTRVFTHGNILINSFLHNIARGSWRLISTAQSEMRTNSGHYEFTIPFRFFGWTLFEMKPKISKANALEQWILEPIMFNFKYLGLVGAGLILPFVKLDVGTAALFLSIPVAQGIAIWNVRRLLRKIPPEKRLPIHDEMLKKVSERTRKLLRIPITLPRSVGLFLKNVATEMTTFYAPLWARSVPTAAMATGSICRSLLRSGPRWFIPVTAGGLLYEGATF